MDFSRHPHDRMTLLIVQPALFWRICQDPVADLLPGGGVPAMPVEVSGETGFSPTQMLLLVETPVDELRELNFPYPGDATDVFTLKTDRGTGYLDQGTGALLAYWLLRLSLNAWPSSA